MNELIKPNEAAANLIKDQLMGCYSGHMASIPNNPVLKSICDAHNIRKAKDLGDFLIECGEILQKQGDRF